MSEKNKDNDVNQQGFKCPFCPCMFSSVSDLERHMDCFGGSKAEHLESYRRAHGRMEHGSFGEQE